MELCLFHDEVKNEDPWAGMRFLACPCVEEIKTAVKDLKMTQNACMKVFLVYGMVKKAVCVLTRLDEGMRAGKFGNERNSAGHCFRKHLRVLSSPKLLEEEQRGDEPRGRKWQTRYGKQHPPLSSQSF